MNNIVQIGPLVFAPDRLLGVLLLLGFIIWIERIGRNAGQDTTRTAMLALGAGVIAGRAVYVLTHLDAYARDWFSILALWQGGFTAWAGIAAAVSVLLWRLGIGRVGAQSLTVVLALSLAWFGGQAMLRPDPQPLPEMPLLARLEGGILAPESLAGKPFVVNLWATWCPPCRRELPMLAEAAEEAAVPILLVNQGEEPGVVAEYLAANHVPGSAVAIDRDAALMSRLGNGALPTTLFVDGQGRIVATHVGEISRAALSDQISKLEMEGEDVSMVPPPSRSAP